MKISILLFALTFAVGGYCQTPYQNGSTVSANGITYKVKLTKDSFVLSNTTNIYADQVNLRYKDGRELETRDEYAMIDCILGIGGENLAFRKSFTDKVILSLRRACPVYKNSLMTIFYVVSPEGNTMEVVFIMDSIPELVSLAPEVFATLEQNLKKYVKWEVNEYGRQLQFTHATSFIYFTKVRLSSEALEKGLDSLSIADPAKPLL